MADQHFKPDLMGSDETLEHLLDRLRSFSIRTPSRAGRSPPDWEFVTNRRPPKGAGGAEAPLPVERPLADLFAAV